MSGKCGIIFFLITITLFDLKLASANENKTLCSETYPSYNAAGIKFNKTRFETVLSAIKTQKLNMISLKEASVDFLEESKKCPNGSRNNTPSHEVYFKVLEYSLGNMSLIQKLNESGGFKCIKSKEAAINACANGNSNGTSAGNNSTLWGNIYAKTRMNFNKYNCERNDDKKDCILKELKECDDDETTVDFVRDLFDFVKETYCPRAGEVIPTDAPGASSRATAAWTSLVVFIVEWAKLLE